MKFVELTGEKYGNLYVLNRAENKRNRVQWHCLCDCGRETIVASDKLRTGHTKSCGCGKGLHTHGKTKTREYRIWKYMRQRCMNPRNTGYYLYGGRGVTVCERWKDSFENFIEDTGEAPSDDHSIDRINPFGNYEPDNCRWATDEEQANNKRQNWKGGEDNAF